MGLAGILLALGLLVWLSYRGWSILLLAPAAALIAAAAAGEPLLAHWTQTFMGGGAQFLALGGEFFVPVCGLVAEDDAGECLGEGIHIVLRLVSHLLGKGLLIPPTPAEMAELSPEVIRMREPAAGYLRDAFNTHELDSFVPDTVAQDSPFEGLACYDGMAPVRPSYLGGYLFGVGRHYGGFMPADPFGLTAIVPSFVDRRKCFWEKGAWETDGRTWFNGTHPLSGLDARSRIIQSFERAADGLPVRVQGNAFIQVQAIGTHTLRATLIDPGFLDPADRPVKLLLRSDLQAEKVVDLLSGESLDMQKRTVALTVPAGALRIVEIHGQF